MSASELESPTEYTALMDAHVGEIRPDLGADRTGRKKKPTRANVSNFVSSRTILHINFSCRLPNTLLC